MPGNPFKRPYRSSGKKPKASVPPRPKVSRVGGSSQMPGVTAPKVQPTVAVKAPSVTVTSGVSPQKTMKFGPKLGGPQLQQPGDTGVKNPKLWEGPSTPGA